MMTQEVTSTKEGGNITVLVLGDGEFWMMELLTEMMMMMMMM